MMRLFIAINFTDEVKDSLLQMIGDLRSQSLEGRFPQKEHMHLTLAFLGEVPEERLDDIKKVMDRSGGKPLLIEISGFGKYTRRCDTLYWCGLSDNTELKNARERLVLSLKEEGIPVDEKAFNPHITLGRKCVMKEGFSEKEFGDKIPKIRMLVEAVSLMKSEQKDRKLFHTEIYRVDLCEDKEGELQKPQACEPG